MPQVVEGSVLERAARAAADAAQWDYAEVPLLSEAIARAVLQAIREPSEGMLEARALGYKGDAWANWQAMIDKALSE